MPTFVLTWFSSCEKPVCALDLLSVSSEHGVNNVMILSAIESVDTKNNHSSVLCESLIDSDSPLSCRQSCRVCIIKSLL